MDGSSPAAIRACNWHASPRYRAYALALLVVVGVVAWVDRNLFAVLLESIKLEFELSDTMLGLLGGVAFGVFYATLGLPVAWLADRYERRSLLAGALALWSACTAMLSFATGAATLFAARVAVGIGEAGGSPPSVSLVSDYFPRERRAFALGLYYLYMPCGFVVGYLAGGWLAEHVGWRAACLWLGLPGVALAALVRFTLREPPRGHGDGAAAGDRAPPLVATLRDFLSRPALRHIPLGGAAHGAGAFAAAIWLPAYLMRTFEVSSTTAGAWLALAYGLGGGAGVLCGGWLADAIVARLRDERWYALWPVVLLISSVPAALTLYLAASPWLAVAALLAWAFVGHAFLGPVVALLQNLAGPTRRAVAAAFYLFLVNLVSMGVGPLAVGFLSDTLAPRFGAAALRYALLAIVAGTTLLAALHFLLAARALARERSVR
jgi:MFS family permease